MHASNDIISAALFQIQEGEEKVIAYFTCTLTKSKRQYCVTRKEILTSVVAVRHFHCYFYGQHFNVRTVGLSSFKNPVGQTARWMEKLGMYDLKVDHRQGHSPGNTGGPFRNAERKEERQNHQGGGEG